MNTLFDELIYDFELPDTCYSKEKQAFLYFQEKYLNKEIPAWVWQAYYNTVMGFIKSERNKLTANKDEKLLEN